MGSRNVILLGYRGSGKSTVGRALAARLGFTFVDTDELTKAAFGGLSVAEIWQKHGEPAFREAEGRTVAEAVATGSRVVALGGGAVTESGEARRAVEQANALRVYLRAPAEVLAQRISTDAGNADERPSLTGCRSAADEVAEVLAHREPTYLAVADAVIDAAGFTVEQIVDAVIAHQDSDASREGGA